MSSSIISTQVSPISDSWTVTNKWNVTKADTYWLNVDTL